MQKNTPPAIMREPGWGTLKHYYTIPYYVAVKFAMRDTIHTIPQPDRDLIYPQAIWHYLTGMAHLEKSNIENALKDLYAEIAAKQNRLDASISLLNEAIKIEDQLNYNEPPD